MAEPLTSSDIWRIEAGWGTSPMASPEERRRFAAAGEIPLPSESVARLAEGRGISPMASTAEKEAWKMGEYMTGRREQAPVEYGGIGDRPTGTSRRSIRMRAEYDEAQKQALEQQRIMQQMDLQQREESRLQRNQDLELQKFNMAEDRESRVLDEAGAIIDGIRGATAQDGTTISNPIRPEDPDAIERLENLGRLKFGMENKSAQDMWSTLYKDALDFREAGIVGAQKETEQQRAWLLGQQEEASALNVDTTKFITTDPQSGEITKVDQLGLSKTIGEAKRKDLETKKSDLAQAVLDKETKDRASSILEEINKIDSEIRKANFSAGREKNAAKRDEFIANSEFYRSERDVLVERFNGLMPQKPAEGATQPQSFDSVEAAQAAKLPKGTIVVIGGRRARID
jgi:hypothetical protein